MPRYAILCGSAPKDFRQKRLVAMHDFLLSDSGGAWKESEIIVFPNGVHELMLEATLNNTLEECTDGEDDGGSEREVLLYLCTIHESDLSTKLSGSAVSGVEVVRLGEDEIRKDVIAYYEGLAERMGTKCRVECEADGELVREEELGWERGV